MEYSFFDLISLFGSLCFFIYGMKVMSEGIQKVAGSKMRKILHSMTSNRFKGVLTGFAITSLVQSSSATTVLVVSFVNTGLITLTESIGIIMGANIGTTITAWVISIIGLKVKIAAYALPIIAIAFPLMLINRHRFKSWGEVFMGFALLFMGLSLLKDSIPNLQSNPEILEFLNHYTDLGFLSILLFVGIGAIITIIVQSSSAAMALTLVMAFNGWISFELSMAMILGENIGTTVTANLAAIIGNVHAKRAALAHLVFNLLGVIWILILFYPALYCIEWYFSATGQSPPSQNPENIPVALSLFHSAFNITNTLLFIGFVNLIASIVTRLIKSSGDDDEFSLEYISTGTVSTGELAIDEARQETRRMGQMVKRMIKTFVELLNAQKAKKIQKSLDKIQSLEEVIDRIEVEITNYIISISSNTNLSKESATKSSKILTIVSDLESSSDILYQMSKVVDKSVSREKLFKNSQIESLNEMLVLVNKALEVMDKNLSISSGKVDINSAQEFEKEINILRNNLKKEYINDISHKNNFDAKRDGWYNDIFQLCEKVGDHIYNVSDTLVS